jgi:hypothetical protein
MKTTSKTKTAETLTTEMITPKTESKDSPATPQKKERKKMNESELNQFRAKIGKTKLLRHFKELSESPVFTEAETWASLPPSVLKKVEETIGYVKNVIHAKEREALLARLADLDAAVPTETDLPVFSANQQG